MNNNYNAQNIGIATQTFQNYGQINIANHKQEKPKYTLPPRDKNFKGREDKINNLMESLKTGGNIIGFCGSGGIGKTSIVTEALWRLKDKNKLKTLFKDGVIWHDFYQNPKAESLFESIAYRYGLEAKPNPFEAAKLALSDKQALLFLDGAEKADDLNSILSIRSGCSAIITSRDKKDMPTNRVNVSPLNLSEASELLKDLGGKYADDTANVKQICKIIGCLPLAVKIAGNYINNNQEPASEYLKWLQTSPLEALDDGKKESESIPLLLKRSFEKISGSAIKVTSVISAFAFAPFNKAIIEAALNNTEIKKDINLLLRYGLISKIENFYIIAHPLIYEYIKKKYPPKKSALKNLFLFYTHFISMWSKHGIKGYNKLDLERPHVLNILNLCKNNKKTLLSEIKDLVASLTDYFSTRGYLTDFMSALKIGLSAVKKSNDKEAEAVFLGNVGFIYANKGELDKALEYYEQALDITKEIGYKEGEANQLLNIGNIYANKGELDKALEYYEQALDITKEIGYKEGEAINLGNIGNIYANKGELDKALEYYEQALNIDKEIGYKKGKANCLLNIGNIYYNKGESEQALEYYEQAEDIFKKIGTQSELKIARNNIKIARRLKKK
ncbi:MAG: tetratricopeptide repeat protein [Deltaproteobacteria bacterium]|nr:tetratricopeptide repeat protein [Deltaproteobacteria bacterium]